MFWISVRAWAMSQLDLGVPDVLVGLDGLVADLRSELHRELGALDLHHDLRRVGGRPVDERLGRARRLRLRLVEARDRVREHVAEAAARRLGRLADGADAA